MAGGWVKGKSGNPAGRPKGAVSKLTAAKNLFEKPPEDIKAVLTKFKLTPLQYLLKVVNDEKIGHSMRIVAAQAAAPYVHEKLAQAKPANPGLVGGGVMEVPIVSSMEEWAAVATASQAQLVKHART